MTLLDMIRDHAEAHPDHLALSAGGRTLTYREFWNGISNTAGSLATAGVKPGDRVLFSVRPNVDGITFALGVVAAGAAVVFADPGDSPMLLEKRLQMTQPKFAAAESLLFTASTSLFRKTALKRGLALPNYKSFETMGFFHSGPRLPGVPAGSQSIKKLSSTAGQVPTNPTGDEDAVIVFTSGTTEDPKAVVHSLNTLSAGIPEMIQAANIYRRSRAITDHFMFGIAVLCAGGWWTIPNNPPSKNVEKWIQEVGESSWTHSFLIPADIVAMLDALCPSQRKPEIENLFTGAAPVLPALVKRVSRELPGTSLFAVYGMTEVLPIALTNARRKLEHNSFDYAGHCVSSVEVSIHEPDANGVGEIVVSGPSVMKGYLGKEPTDRHFTGDMGKLLDSKTAVALVGRKKDMLIRGNRNLYPGLFEPVLNRMHGIEQAAIVGVPDVYGDDIVVLFLVGSEESVSLAKSRLPEIMDHDSQPDIVVHVAEIPLKGRSSKPDRITLRETARMNPYVIEILNQRKETI